MCRHSFAACKTAKQVRGSECDANGPAAACKGHLCGLDGRWLLTREHTSAERRGLHTWFPVYSLHCTHYAGVSDVGAGSVEWQTLTGYVSLEIT